MWPDTVEHGTVAGRIVHSRRNIPVCDDCRRAKTEYDRRSRTRTKERLRQRPVGACADVDPAIFHTKDTIVQAIAVCNTCPVTVECADYRVDVERHLNGPAVGVWAGELWVEDTGGSGRAIKREKAA